MVSPTSQQTRVLDWLKDHLPKDESIQLADITSMYTVVNVIGPKAGALISELSLSDIDINLQPFTFKVCERKFQDKCNYCIQKNV